MKEPVTSGYKKTGKTKDQMKEKKILQSRGTKKTEKI